MEDDGSGAQPKRSVLVIDDDEAACCLVEDILSLDGIVVEKAVGGEAGVRLISRKSFPIIITDLKMPDIDGLGVIDFIKKRGMESLVIVITGYVSIDSVIGALRAGAYDYIIKPFSADLLRLTVERAFDYIELMRNKQKARYLDAITQLAQTTAHEISQPLTLVIGRTKEICDNAQNLGGKRTGRSGVRIRKEDKGHSQKDRWHKCICYKVISRGIHPCGYRQGIIWWQPRPVKGLVLYLPE